MKRSAFISLLLLTASPFAPAAVGDSVDTTYHKADGVQGYNDYVYATSSRFYDSAKSTADDSLMCWAHSFTNSAQYWQTYYGVFAKKNVPYGADSTYTKWADKVTKLQIANDFRTYFRNTGGSFSLAANWFMKGDAPPEKLKLLGGGGYYSEYYTDSSTEIKHNVKESDMDTLTTVIFNAFGISFKDNTYTQTQAGLIPFLDIAHKVDNGDEYGHTLTCYSFKTDSEGRISTLYLADPDNTDGSPLLTAYIGKDTTTGALTLYSDADKTIPMKPDQEHSWFIRSVSYINTPEVLQNMLAEYSDTAHEAQVWNGAGSEWGKQTATTEALPTEATGWDINVNGNNIAAKHQGYYHTYATEGRAVLFDDHAAEDKRTVTIRGEVAASLITVAAKGYVFQKAESGGSIAAGADLALVNGATLDSSVALNVNNLKLEGGTTITTIKSDADISDAAIVVTGDFLAALAPQAATFAAVRSTVTPQASVNAPLDLRQADSVTLETSVNMNDNNLYIAMKDTELDNDTFKLVLNMVEDEVIPCFTNIGDLYIGDTKQEYSFQTATQVYFGGDANNPVDYFLVYDSALSTLSLMLSIPEPTTATLGLLALAAMAARRRRS